MGKVENSGFPSRPAFLVDTFMSRLGLDGLAFVMQFTGFGCDVPARMGMRIMRSRGLRFKCAGVSIAGRRNTNFAGSQSVDTACSNRHDYRVWCVLR